MNYTELLDERFSKVFSKLPPEFFDRLSGTIIWMEIFDGLEITFNVKVLESKDDYFHLGFSATGFGERIGSDRQTLNVEICKSYILKRASQRAEKP